MGESARPYIDNLARTLVGRQATYDWGSSRVGLEIHRERATGGEKTYPKEIEDVVDHVSMQEGAARFDGDVRRLDGEERATWWERAVAAYPDYADFQSRTDRVIPVFVATSRA